MRKKIYSIIKRRIDSYNELAKYEKISYSQSGEDLIVDYVLNQLQITNPTYLDLGAHHPHYLNNTYYFYRKGNRGINVEPDPSLIQEFNRLRSDDINLNVGIGFQEADSVATFYVMTARTLNTFSQEEALRVQEYGSFKIEQRIQVPLVSVNQVIKKNFSSVYPNFVSIDVEGLDFEIIQTFDFDAYKPEVFCVETITYTEDKSERKLTEVIDYMISKGYFVYADTYINTIFVNTDSWKNRLV